MRILTATLFAILLLTPAASVASTYLDSFYGTPVDGGNARALAMGAVGVSMPNGSASVLHNPALLTAHADGWVLDFQVGIHQVNEDRLVPLFDSFDSIINKTAFAVNRNLYGFGEGGLVVRLPGERNIVVGTGIYERYDAEYDYFEEVRDPDPNSLVRDTILQFNELRFDGQLRSWSTGLGTELIEGVDIGVTVHRYFGEFDRLARVAPTDANATYARFLRELSGWGWTVGAQVDATSRISLGASFEAPVRVEGSHSTTAGLSGAGSADPDAPAAGDYAIEYPGVVNLGFTYRPQNELATTVSFQATHRMWEDLEDTYQDEVARLAAEAAGGDPITVQRHDTWDFRMGVEHVFYNGTPLRFGFRWIGSYLDEEVYRTVFSAGVGQRIGDLTIDLTGLYHRQASQQPYLFDPSVPGFEGAELINEVQDSVVSFLLGFSRGF